MGTLCQNFKLTVHVSHSSVRTDHSRDIGPIRIFFDSALAHMSPPNRSEGSRRSYACIYGAGRMSYTAPESAMRTDTVAGAAPSYHFEMIPSSTSSKL